MRFRLVSQRDTEDADGDIRFIHMRRFIDSDRLAGCRARLRFADKCEEMLMDGALQALEEAGKAHCCLEEIYKSAMDFRGVEKETQRLCAYVEEAVR